MPVVDATALNTLDCDVCIIGTGPAGATLARELSHSRMRVTVLESGGFEQQAQADALNEIESVGWPRVMDQWLVRNRIVGGSSHTWTGRCAPFDEIDFEQRDWVPHSGWPISLKDLTPYLDRSSRYLGLGVGTGFTDDRFWDLAGHKMPPGLDPTILLPFFWQYSRDTANPYDYMRFGRHLGRLGANITLVTNATVIRINAVEDRSAVKSVTFVSPDGTAHLVTAPIVVLCAGGIENPRLLLASALGNDLVGRFLMDHPRGVIGQFRNTDAPVMLRRFGVYKARGHGNHLFQSGMRLSPSLQHDEQLLNGAAWISETIAENDPWHALKRFLRGNANLRADSLTIMANAGLMARGLNDYFIRRQGLPRSIDGITLDGMVEQRLNPNSRVTLSGRHDRFGSPLARIDWQVHADEGRTLRRLGEAACEQFTKLGLPAPILEDWVRDGAMFPETFVDIAHPTGATRMAHSATEGVVDSDGQVHGVHGLYVAGSSIFPTAGHCNPTQMIVALTLRLGDTLKDRASASSLKSAISPTARVLVTGGTGNIGRHVVAELVARGYQVRALTSKPITGREPLHDRVEWQQVDFHQTLNFDAVVRGCDAVLHLAAELGDMARMQRANVDATRALAVASEQAGIKVFCYVSSTAVYGSGRGRQRQITEDSPVLTADSDVRSEYWATETVRCYARTKLLGEKAIEKTAQKVEYVILRPTVVVDVPDLIAVRDWSTLRKHFAASRHAHHIYVRDVADAMLWFMERGLQRQQPQPGVNIFNLAEDEFPDNTYGYFFKQAYIASKDARFRVINLPWQADYFRAIAQNRSWPLRQPYGRMIFSTRKLQAAGYTPRFGMASALNQALDTIRSRS